MRKDSATKAPRSAHAPARDTSDASMATEPGSSKRPVRWKLVIAADDPWAGVLYETRAGHRRESFGGPAKFLQALTRLTDWQWPPHEL